MSTGITNPFDEMIVQELGQSIPMAISVQAAIGGTVDDEISEHAESLFALLDEHDAWDEAAMLLVQFNLADPCSYSSGPDGAKTYLEQQPDQVLDEKLMPVMALTHIATAGYLMGGRENAALVWGEQPARVRREAAKILFALAVSRAGWPSHRHDELLDMLHCNPV